MRTFKPETLGDDPEAAQRKAHLASARIATPTIWKTTSLHFLVGGVLVLILVAVLVSFTFLRGQIMNLFAPSRPVTHSSQVIPAATPVRSAWWNDHNVTVTVVDKVAYVGAFDGTVSALRTSDGVLLWRYSTHGVVKEAPLVVNGIVYVASQDHMVYALRASDGSLLWRYSSGNLVYSPILVNGVAYVASLDGSISALRASSGSLLWRHQLNGNLSDPLTIVNGVIYAESNYRVLTALQESDGALLWRYTINEDNFSSPVVDNGIVYMSSDQGTLYAIQVSNGTLLWRYALDGGAFGSPVIINGVVYIGATASSPETASTRAAGYTWLINAAIVPFVGEVPYKSGITSVYALRASDGVVLWHHKINETNVNTSGTWLIVVDGVVYVGAAIDTDAGSIYALKSGDGSLLWHFSTDGDTSWPLIAGGKLYIDSLNGSVYALQASDGSLLWRYSVLGTILDTPVLDGQLVYVGSANGIVYTLQANVGSLRWSHLA